MIERRHVTRREMPAIVPRSIAIMLVTSCGAPPPQEPVGLPRLQLVEELRLDAAAEDFSAFSRVIVNAHGTMAIPLRQDRHVRIYDTAGRRLMTLGRQGSGPGEFQGIGAVTWLGDTLVANDDHQTRRVHYFGPGGELLRTRILPPAWTPEPVGGAASDSAIGFFLGQMSLPDGGMLGTATLMSGASSASGAPSGLVIALLSSTGAARVVVGSPLNDHERSMVWIDGLGNAIPFVFPPQVTFAMDGSRFGFLTTDQSRIDGSFAVSIFRAEGDTLFARDYPVTGEPIPAAVMDSAIAAMVTPPGRPREDRAPPADRFQAAARQRAPAIYSPVEQMALAVDGTIWVTLRGTAAGRNALILDSLGAPVATVRLPDRSRVQQATASRLWVTEVDEDGLTSVVRYRIVRPE